jgi:hypothetical protein
MRNHVLENPADKYPRPPYPRQSQPWPGLASRMDPRPDHGKPAIAAPVVWQVERRS